MKQFLTLLILIPTVLGFGQNNTRIGYDAAGNRISRVTIIDFAGIQQSSSTIVNDLEFVVFPNNVTTTLTIEIDPDYQIIENGSFVMYDYTGKIVFESKVKSRKEILNLDHLTRGPYLLKLEHPNNQTVEWKIIKN